VSVIFTVAAIGVSLGRSWQVGVAILVASVVLVGLVRFVGYFEYLFLLRRQRARVRSPDVEALRRVLPRVPALFERLETEEEIFATLAGLLVAAEIVAVELVPMGEAVQVREWSRNILVNAEEVVSARFPLGPDRLARAELRFRWTNVMGEVVPQAEVLLQVIVDVVAAALARAQSAFAPLPALAPAVAAPRVQNERLSTPPPLQVET
jgi:hypothetical protein